MSLTVPIRFVPLVAVLAMTGSIVPRPDRTIPPPPPPQLELRRLGNPPAHVVLANSAGDSVVLESDELVDYAGVYFAATLHDSRSAIRLELRDGTWLRLDGNTPAGTYTLKDGRRIQLGNPHGYPRHYEHSMVPELTLFFVIRSTSRVGVFLSEDSGARVEIDELAHAYPDTLERHGREPKLRDGEPAAAFEFPADWYRRASIGFPLESHRRVLVVWVAYGEPGDVAPRYLPARTRTVRFTDVVFPVRHKPPTRDLLERTGRIIGQATIDVGTRRVHVSRPGDE